MKKLITLALAALLAVTLLVGCSSSKTATIELPGNPTTGYTWTYTVSPDGVVQEKSNEYVADPAESDMTGVGGIFKFEFKAVAPGEAQIDFSYDQEWEGGDKGAATASYKVTVDDKKNITVEELSKMGF